MERNSAENGHLVTFDERTETWYVETRGPQRLPLTREAIEELLRLYNSIHTGRQLLLQDERAARRVEDQNLRLARTVRDLYLLLESRKRRGIRERIGSSVQEIIRRLPSPARPR